MIGLDLLTTALRYVFTEATVATIATGVFLLKRLLVSCPLSSEQVVLLQR